MSSKEEYFNKNSNDYELTILTKDIDYIEKYLNSSYCHKSISFDNKIEFPKMIYTNKNAEKRKIKKIKIPKDIK